MLHQNLMNKALQALAGLGDVYTDAPECAASVAAAQNLATLAQLLPSSPTLALHGALLAAGTAVCVASVSIDGTVSPQVPAESLTMEGPWSLRTPLGQEFRLAHFAGEFADDTKWVISDAQAFYQYLLSLAPRSA